MSVLLVLSTANLYTQYTKHMQHLVWIGEVPEIKLRTSQLAGRGSATEPWPCPWNYNQQHSKRTCNWSEEAMLSGSQLAALDSLLSMCSSGTLSRQLHALGRNSPSWAGLGMTAPTFRLKRNQSPVSTANGLGAGLNSNTLQDVV